MAFADELYWQGFSTYLQRHVAEEQRTIFAYINILNPDDAVVVA
jgi:hypothetical protein